MKLGEKAVPDVSVDLLDSLVKWIPSNPFEAFASGNILQIIVFAIITGLILAPFNTISNSLAH